MPAKKLKSIVVRAVICFFLAGTVLSPVHLDSAAAESRPLWKIRAKNNIVYLLGSIHYLKPQNYPLDGAIEAAFGDAKKLVFEIDLESAEGGQRERLTVVGLKLQAMGFDPGQGIDRYFFRKAKKERKETHGFETLEYQLGLFDGLPERVQEALLLQSLGDAELTEAAVDAVVKAWASGDLKRLDALLLQGMRDHPELYRALIVDRNLAWLPKIESYLAHHENYLVVVGAAHLAGRDGLIEMLKAKGYAVEQ